MIMSKQFSRLAKGPVAGLIAGLAGAALAALAAATPAAAAVFNQPSNSSPISISADQRLVWVVNPRDDTVSVLRADTGAVIATLQTGNEPRSVALDPNNAFAYVANAAEGTVTVIKILSDKLGAFSASIDRTLVTGAEPWDIVSSPDGKRIFVANSGQDTVTVINAATRTIIGHVNLRDSLCNNPDRNRRFQPRGMAVTLANSQLYVTRFLSFTSDGGRQASDVGKEGVVCRVAINTSSTNIADYVPAQRITFAPALTGFNIDSTGDAVADPTSAYPNQMQSIVLRGNKGYMPNIGASPEGPQTFNTSTHAFLTVMNEVGIGIPGDGGTLNLHLGARNPESGKKRLFFANPWAIAFTNQSGAGSAYVVSAGSDLLVKLKVNANDAASFTVDSDTTRYIDLNDPANPATRGDKAGRNPQGIAILGNGLKAFVTNQVSGNVSIIDVAQDRVEKVVQTALVAPSGSFGEQLNVGAEMFFSSRGNFVRPGNATVSTSERLSNEGWQSCASCHFNGWTDGVIWQFPSGPRKSVNLAGSFNPQNRSQQKILNYSAIFDEIEDFELNIRNVSGPGPLSTGLTCQSGLPTSTFDPNHGLMIGDTGKINFAPCIINTFVKPNAGREEVAVDPPGATARVEALTALRDWIKFAVRVPNGPLDSKELAGGVATSSINAGRNLFASQCANCHGGGLWSASVKDFVSPPATGQITCEVDLGTGAPAGSACVTPPVTGNPVAVQFLRRFLEDVGSFNLGVPGKGNLIGDNVGADELAAATLSAGAAQPRRDALGIDYNGDGEGVGFNVQSLLGIHLVQPFMHNGACETIACVVGDVKHRTGNGRFTDLLTTAQKRRDVVSFVESIDAATATLP
jgi:YVTN family beta-propeller protein